METEKNQKLPVSNQKGSAMTKKGAYAAISYMASAGSFIYVYIFFITSAVQ